MSEMKNSPREEQKEHKGNKYKNNERINKCKCKKEKKKEKKKKKTKVNYRNNMKLKEISTK